MPAAAAPTSAPTTTSTPDNNIAATQSANASFAAANPSTFTNPASASAPTTPPNFNSVSSTNLQPSTPANLPVVQSPDTSGAIVAGAQQTLSDNPDINPPPTALDQQQQSILDNITSLTNQDSGKAQALLDQQAALGVPTDQQAITNAQNEISTKTASYNQMQANLGGNNSVETSAVLAAQNAGLLKAQAADIGISQAKLTAAQGNLNLALTQASAAVDAKYSTIEDNIKTQQAQLTALQPLLTKEQTAQSEVRQAALASQAATVAYQRDQEKSVAGLMVQYPNANIQSTDTLLQASQKAAQAQALNPTAGKLQIIGSHLDANGNKVDTYGFVNETTGVVTPYSSDSSQGNMNLGMVVGNSMGLPMYNTGANNPGVNRPTRNNNPGNIEATPTSIKRPGVVGIEQNADGRQMLIFANPAQGQQAIAQLLQSSTYSGLTAEQAILKYSGNSYGAADVGLDPTKPLSSQITDQSSLQNLVSAISQREGFSSNSSSSQTPGVTGSPAFNTSAPGYTTDKVTGAGGLSQAAIDQAALSYALTGVLPAGSRTSTGPGFAQATAIKARAAELNSTGNIQANKTQLTSLGSNLTTQTTYLNTIQRSIDTVDQNLTLLQNAASKVNNNSSPLVNEWANLAKTNVIGSGDLASYKAAIQTVRSEYSNILARGGTVTDAVRGEAATLIPDNISKDQLSQVLATLKSEGQNVLSGAQQQVQTIQGQINGIISVGSGSQNSTSSQTPSEGQTGTVNGVTYQFTGGQWVKQ